MKRRAVEFEIGDLVWAILTKDRFSVGDYNKLAARKIGPLEILEKINLNAYRLKLPSHITTSDVFNVKHLVSYIGDLSTEDSNSRVNSLKPGKDDVDPYPPILWKGGSSRRHLYGEEAYHFN